MIAMILSALLPVFLVLGLGYHAGRRPRADRRDVASLNTFLMDYALPSAMFTVIVRTPLAAIRDNGPLLGVQLLGMGVAFLAVLALERRIPGADGGKAAVQALTVALPNYIAVGLPLLERVYGPGSTLGVMAAAALAAVTVSPLTLVLMANAASTDPGAPWKRFLQALGRTARRPIIWAPLAGAGFLLAGVQVPDMIGRAFALLGLATAAVALFLTGMILSSFPLRWNRAVAAGVLVKNVAQPLGAWLVVRALGMPALAAGQTVLLIALPAGFSGVVFGADMEVRNEVAGATMVWSSLLSVGTLAVALLVVAPR